MSTVIDLTEQELAELKELTNEGDVVDAVRHAMSEYLRFARRMRLKRMSGQVQMEENWRVLEEAEVREQDGGRGVGPG
jgi:hypothetical protein